MVRKPFPEDRLQLVARVGMPAAAASIVRPSAPPSKIRLAPLAPPGRQRERGRTAPGTFSKIDALANQKFKDSISRIHFPGIRILEVESLKSSSFGNFESLEIRILETWLDFDFGELRDPAARGASW